MYTGSLLHILDILKRGARTLKRINENLTEKAKSNQQQDQYV